MPIYVQFKDESEKEIVSWYGGKPKPDSEPFLGEVEADDPRYKKYYEDSSYFVREAIPIPT